MTRRRNGPHRHAPCVQATTSLAMLLLHAGQRRSIPEETILLSRASCQSTVQYMAKPRHELFDLLPVFRRHALLLFIRRTLRCESIPNFILGSIASFSERNVNGVKLTTTSPKWPLKPLHFSGEIGAQRGSLTRVAQGDGAVSILAVIIEQPNAYSVRWSRGLRRSCGCSEKQNRIVPE